MSKEHAYAYEAGYRDGSINYELEHCPACKNVADLQEALAENEKLREEFNKMDVWHSKELTAAMDENAKLRKLFSDFWAWANPPFALKSGTFEQFMEIADRARELGMEVD